MYDQEDEIIISLCIIIIASVLQRTQRKKCQRKIRRTFVEHSVSALFKKKIPCIHSQKISETLRVLI
jgi:hypothetical protein